MCAQRERDYFICFFRCDASVQSRRERKRVLFRVCKKKRKKKREKSSLSRRRERKTQEEERDICFQRHKIFLRERALAHTLFFFFFFFFFSQREREGGLFSIASSREKKKKEGSRGGSVVRGARVVSGKRTGRERERNAKRREAKRQKIILRRVSRTTGNV